MDKKYNVDDILDDIKRKKQGRSSVGIEDNYTTPNVVSYNAPEPKPIKPKQIEYMSEKSDATQEFSDSRLASAKPRPDFSAIRQEAIKPKESFTPSKPLPVKTSAAVEPRKKEDITREEAEQRHKELYAKLATLEQPNKKPVANFSKSQVEYQKEDTPEPSNPVRISKSIAAAFGDNAYKPYEDTAKKDKQGIKGFAPIASNFNAKTPRQVAPRPTKVQKEFETQSFRQNTQDLPTYEQEKPQYKSISESIRDTVRESIPNNTEPKEYGQKSASEGFKLNIVNSFFEDEVTEHTHMDIPIKNIDNANAADGFTRSLPPLSSRRVNDRHRTVEKEEKHLQDDYQDPSEADEIYIDLKRAATGAKIRFFIMTIIFVVLTYVAYSLNNPVPLPAFMFPEQDPFNFVAVNLALTVIGALICSNAVGTGLIALFTLKPDSDTPIAMALLATIAQGVALLVSPDNIYTIGVNMYFAVIGFGLFTNCLGKLFMAIRIRNNFKIIATKEEKYAVGLFSDKSIVKELTRGQHIQKPEVAYSCKAEFLTGYLYYSYSEDYSENLNRVASPLFLVFNTLIAIVSYFLFKNLYITLTAFTALMCICSPATATIVGNLPLLRISKKLNKKKAAIAGYKSLEDFDDVTTVAVDANELFLGGNIALHGIKPFAEDRIDEAIIDAASVIMQANGLLTDIFLEMIGRKENLLKEVDSLVYEDCMGLSAWVDSKRVLIGNRELMENHGIDVPPYEYERKFANSGREIVYIANSGELTAMFVISYHGTDNMSENLSKLEAKGIGLSVYTTDPNITANKLQEIFGFPADMITIMSSKVHAAFNQTACDREKAPAKVALPSDFVSNISAICSILSGKTAVVFGTILQLLGLILGYAFIVFYTFTGEIGTITYLYLIGYQTIWGIFTTLLANLRRV